MSWASSEAARRTMQGNRKRDTSPELLIRRALHQAGLRYRVQFPVPGARRRTIDIAFTRSRLAIFVDGCFWHGCPLHGTSPRANADYWLPKLRRNQERDRETSLLLSNAGWQVLRFWEHEAPEAAVSIIEDALRAKLPVRTRVDGVTDERQVLTSP